MKTYCRIIFAYSTTIAWKCYCEDDIISRRARSTPDPASFGIHPAVINDLVGGKLG